MQFDIPKDQSSIIKVIGVGGGGSNAVNHMFAGGIRGVNFVICNTDAQALDISPVPNKIQLGPELTQGLGAGSKPEIGRMATEESMEDIREILEKNTKMVFVTAGMGGGTGTGGAPVIAKVAHDMGILTVGIVTTPFNFEGKRKLKQAEEGIEFLRQYVDSILVISNDKIREIYGNLTRDEAFSQADDILLTAAKSIAEIITVAGQINVDFADVEYVMKNSGVSIMGSSMAEGTDRAERATHGALNSPLLNDNNIRGAKKMLLNITSGRKQVTIDEIDEINAIIQEYTGGDVDLIFGTCDDPMLEDKLSVTVIATGFEVGHTTLPKEEKKVTQLNDEVKAEPVMNTENVMDEVPAEIQLKAEQTELKEEIKKENLRIIHEIKWEAEEAKAEEENTIANQFEFEFDMTEQEMSEEDQAIEGMKIIVKEQEQTSAATINSTTETTIENSTEKQSSGMNNEERIKRLKNLSMKLSNPNNVVDLEKEPAYMRRGVDLDDVPHSSESNLSNYTLSKDGINDKPELKQNNSFLHDQVD